jgi:hypothetical protein
MSSHSESVDKKRKQEYIKIMDTLEKAQEIHNKRMALRKVRASKFKSDFFYLKMTNRGSKNKALSIYDYNEYKLGH